MEVINYGRTTNPFFKKLGMVSFRSNSNGCFSYNVSELTLFFIFLLLYFADATLSLIGLNMGIYQHYNPLGIMIFKSTTSIGFASFRVISAFAIYKIFLETKLKNINKLLSSIGIYIYFIAILWDLHSFQIINIYNFPSWIVSIHKSILDLLFLKWQQ